MVAREALIIRDTRETKISVYLNLDDIKRSERTHFYDPEKKTELAIPPPGITCVINDKPYQELVKSVDERIRNDALSLKEIDDYSKIFGEYFWSIHFPHWWDQISRHGNYDLRIYAEGPDGIAHHMYEDVAINVGKAFDSALGGRSGIKRFGRHLGMFEGVHTIVGVDISGRPSSTFSTEIHDPNLRQMIEHTGYSFANNAKMTITAEVKVLDPSKHNDHHNGETIFKGLALALSEATAFDPRKEGQVPSTKGKIDN